ncbi:MAG: iron ABC transporter permease [Methanomethylophilus sp.]
MSFWWIVVLVAVAVAAGSARWFRDRLVPGMRRAIDGLSRTHLGRKKHRARFIIAIGALLLLAAIIVSLCLGPARILSPPDALGALFSAVAKGGSGLTDTEMTVYNSRLPRTLVAAAVGLGLSVAGAVYQALIRNPLVDPYIMGVSSGAGTAAVAVIAFDFTFFGLLAPHSIYLTAVSAIAGGLLAFACTMLLAQKAGGTANAYVLSGVVVGLAFSAVQTVMIIFAGDQLANALLWLFGSFSSVTWTEVLPVLLPVLTLSLLLTRWAKEFNLVLLGEDQARQMGLNARRFTALMLVLASVLASFCVAFCGIIGFVGLVIPHLCRMLFGGDHRLVLPASMLFGAVLLIAADLTARMALPGTELPVGAITTIIGVPVFAYLLIKRGKIYNG